MEANFKRTLTNLESENNIKEGAFKEMSDQLKMLGEDNLRIESELVGLAKSEK